MGCDQFRLAEELLDFDVFDRGDLVSKVADDLEKDCQHYDADTDCGNWCHPHDENIHIFSSERLEAGFGHGVSNKLTSLVRSVILILIYITV